MARILLRTLLVDARSLALVRGTSTLTSLGTSTTELPLVVAGPGLPPAEPLACARRLQRPRRPHREVVEAESGHTLALVTCIRICIGVDAHARTSTGRGTSA